MVQYNDGKVSQVRRRRSKRMTKRSTGLSVAQRRSVAKIAKRVADKKPEVKRNIVNATASGVDPSTGSPDVIDLSSITEGLTDDGNRVGLYVSPKYLGVRYRLTGRNGATQPIANVRFMVVQYKSNTASAGVPTWNLLLQQVTAPFSYRNNLYTDQFKVLYDAKHIIVNYSSNEAFTVYGDVSIPEKALRAIQFNDTNTTGSNKVYLMAISDYTGADFYSPLLSYSAILRYTDS